jgi:hypothetical protein
VRLPGITNGQICRERQPGEAAGRGCRAKLPGDAAGRGCRPRLPGKTAGQGCRARLKMLDKPLSPTRVKIQQNPRNLLGEIEKNR